MTTPPAPTALPALPDLAGVRVLRTDGDIDCAAIDAALTGAGAELSLRPPGVTAEHLARRIADVDLLLTCYAPITARVIDAAPRLRGIVKYGVGIDAIDIEAAMRRGVPVVNVPAYAERTVAEGAFALLLALSRKLVPLSRAMLERGWVSPEPAWLGTDVAGSTVALVGVGRIGRSMARMAGAGFGARVIGYSPHTPARELRAAGVEPFDDLHAMLGEADVVSIHCVLNAGTRGLIGPAEFAAMTRRPLFINVSRGAIVDEGALLDALRAGRIAGAGLDVFTDEPLDRDAHRLRELYERDDVLLTPHLTFYTEQAMHRLSVEVLARCREILAGEPVSVASTDPRLRAQRRGVRFVD